MKLSVSYLIIVAIALTVAHTGCSDATDPFSFQQDFTTVQELPDTSQAEKVELESGLVYYRIEEGSGKWTVQPRGDERLLLFLTMRVKGMEENDGIIQATRMNGVTTPETVGIASLSEPEGLFNGIVGMKEGEHRVLVVPPKLGFEGVSQTNQFFALRNDTLIYEIEIVEIL